MTIARRNGLTAAVLAIFSFATALPAPAQQPAQNDDNRNANVTDAKAPDVLIVEGQVTDAIGAGIKDVEVTVFQQGMDGSPADPLATAKTDRIGDFAVMAGQAIKGAIVVTFSSPQFTTFTWSGDATTDDEPPYLAITLEGNLRVTGRVLSDATNQPIQGAAVEFRSMAKRAYTDTDEDGRYTFEKLSRGAATLIVTAEGYGKEQEAVSDTADPQGPIIKLKPERILHLEIINNIGQPITAVTVELLVERNRDVRLFSSDAEGKLTVRNLCSDCTDLAVRLHHEDHVSSAGFDREITIEKDAVESSQVLIMTVAGSMAGTITSAADQQKLNGARITTGDGSSDRSPRDWSNYRGKYEIKGIQPGQTVVTTHLSGFAPELSTVKIVGGNVTKLDIQLTPACTIRGSVITESKTPLPHADVHTGEWRGHSTLDLRATTDANGKFLIENAPCDELELIVVSPDRHRTAMTIKGVDNTEHVFLVPEVDMQAPTKEIVKVGDPVPALSLTSLAGQQFELDKLTGKVIVIDFWATWCGPCIKEWPAVERIQQKYGDRDDFILIGVSQDWEKATVLKFLRKKKERWPQIVGETAGAEEASNRFGVQAIPALFVIDKTGKFAATYSPAEHALQTITALLNNPNGSNEPK